MGKEYLDKAGLTYLWSKIKTYVANAVKVTGVKGNAESSYRTGNVNITAANVGAAPSSHTHGANDITSVRESEITWGNKDFRSNYSVGDVFLNDYLRANRFSGLKAEGITIEYSHDNGVTWTAYETTDLAKRNLFTINGDYSISGSSTTLATASDQLRITVDTGLGGIYSYLNKFHIYVSTNGSNDCTVSIDAAPSNDIDNFNTNICTDVGIAGWSGWNVIHIPFSFCTAYTSQSTSTNYRKIRFLFKHSGITGTTYNGLKVLRIFAFGGVGYSTPTSMALTGHAYTFNGNMDVTFPAVVTATEFKGNVEIKQNAASTEDECIPTVGDRVQFFRTTTTTTGADGHVIGFTWSSPTKYGAQLYIDTDPTYNMSIRQRDSSGAWKPWKKIFTANDAIPVENGGTGQTSVKSAANSFMNALDTGSSTPVDADYYISQYVGGGTTTTTYHRRPVSALWEYIRGKISSVLGLTSTNYGGNAATATNASKVNNHTIESNVPANAKFTDTTYTGTSPISINSSNQVSINTASTSAYGATKLSTSTSSTATDLAATPSAVKSAYDLANTANGTANTALSGVNGNLIYDHTFTISNGVATFTPHVYQKGEEVTSNYAASCFTWKYRLINGSEVSLTTKSDRGCDVTISNLGYGGHVIGAFTPPE